jgi:hypothetical protein
MGVVINEVCDSGVSKQKNTGAKKQCLEGAVRTYILAKDDFSFADTAAAKLKTNWDAAKKSKKIAVFYDVEELEPNNTEAQIKAGRFADYKISEAKKGVNYTHYLSTCSYEALKSYENSGFTRVFRVTEKNELLCETQQDGKIKGEPLTSFIVGIRDDAPADGIPSVKVNLKFDSYSLSILNPDFDLTGYEGVYDLDLKETSLSATSIKFKATSSCSGNNISALKAADVVLKNELGAIQNPTFVPADSNGVYELTGTGFVAGFKLSLNGIVTIADIDYEAQEIALT